MKKLVSVIIACYNAEEYIDDCIKALLAQTYSNLEIIICDDASTDNSYIKLCEWKEKDNRITVLNNDKNLYAAETRNNCIAISKGDYLLIQDVDDISKTNRVERLVAVLESEDIDFVSSAMSAFDTNPQETFKLMKQKKMYPKKKDFLWNLPFYHPATMFTREAIMAVDGYRVAEETRRGQDYDMFMRMYAKGFKGKNLEESLYLFRLDNANIKRRTFKARIGEYKIRKRGFKELGLLPLGWPFLFKPFIAHVIQQIRYSRRRIR